MAVLYSLAHNSPQCMPMVGDGNLVRSDCRSTVGAGYTRKAEAEQDQVRNTRQKPTVALLASADRNSDNCV